MVLEVLTTSYGSNAVQVAQTRKLIALLEQKKVAFQAVDGVEQAERRKELWAKSGTRSYPQVFLNGEYLGDMDKIEVRSQPIGQAPWPTHRTPQCAGG
jgi:glutaredoxin